VVCARTCAREPRSCGAPARAVRLVGDFCRSERAADDQLRERVSHLAVGFQVGLDVLLQCGPSRPGRTGLGRALTRVRNFVERFMPLCEDMAGGMGGSRAVG
jgi:hypothetical protein